MQKKRIAIDMDQVMADVVAKYLDLFEQKMGRRPLEEEYQGKKVYDLKGGEWLRSCLFEKGFFADLPVMEGSQKIIKTLMVDYEVFIVTAATEFRNSLADKVDWLAEYFPFIHWKNIVLCGDKSVIRADYMIDDHVFNLKTFQGKGLLFTASHNIYETDYTRVNNWEEVLKYFQDTNC